MRFSLPKLALALTMLLASTQSVFAQNYPPPGKQGQPPVVCIGCQDKNSTGQDNDGLKTWPYASPLVNHTGRFLDANFIANFQFPPRTLRARRIRVARAQRGAAPPRAYIQLGSSIGVYSLDRFFATTLPAGTVSIQTLTAAKRPGYTPEKVARWDGFVDPETSPSWITPTADGQDRLFDFDYDDRGYLYVAAGFFGWGIVRDNGETSGSQLSLVSQTLVDTAGVPDPKIIFSLKTGGRYYAVVSDDNSMPGRRVWDVSDPVNPVSGSFKAGSQYAILSWAKDDARGRIAIVTGQKRIEIYDAAGFVSGQGPLQTFAAGTGKKYRDVTADGSGNFWTTEATSGLTSNRLIKLERVSSTSYTSRSFDVYGGPFAPEDQQTEGYNTIEYGDKYLTVVGRVTGSGLDVRLFKVDSGEPIAVELNEFFKKYYWNSPADYALPSGCTVSFGVYPITWNNKTYLLQSTNGIGDVFEMQSGDSIAATQKSGIFGTTNPNSRPTESGPFYADLLKFRAESSNPLAAYTVLWDFDNTESGAANEATARTGEDVEHQFTGLNTVTKITQVRQVRVNAPISAEMTDQVSVTLKVPVARMGIGSTNVALTADNGSLDLIAGDALSDASDGTVESHFATWTIDAVQTKLLPNQTIPAGDVGPHTATLAASYGKYDGSFNTVGSPYVDSVSNVSYVVRPFIVELIGPTTSGNTATFRGTARKTSLTTVLSALTWTVEWSLKTAGGVDVAAPASSVVPVGTIPNFTVADKSAIPSGSILKLRAFVLPAEVSPSAAAYVSHEVTQTLITPDPQITKSGCANAGDACSFTASSLVGNPISGWTMTWTLLKNDVQVGSPFTGNPFVPVISVAGTYSVSLTATTSVFVGNATTPDFAVAAPVCSNPPTVEQMSIFTNCSAGCETGQAITIKGDPYQYTPEDCEQYMWNFGDGTSATTGPGPNGRTTTHTYSSKGNKTIRLTVKKGSQTSPEFTRTITVGQDDPPPTCNVANSANFNYTGSKGCSPSTNCKVGETVTFTGLKNSSALQSCDTTSWTFHNGPTTSKTPQKTYSAAGPYDVTLVISNTAGPSATVTKTLTIVPDDTPTECLAPSEGRITVTFRGRQSNCTGDAGSPPCTAGEIIDFRSALFPLNNPQSCDRFEWSFGDQTTNVATQTSTHTYSANGTYQARLKWFTTTNSTGITIPLTVPVGNAIPLKKVPELAFSQFPGAGAKGTPVSFTVNVTNLVDVPNATGWVWNFGDGGSPISQAGTGSSATIQHTYTKTGTFSVSVKARNAEDTPSAQTGQAVALPGIVITDTPEFKFLLPVVTHGPGQNNSTWRTDVQIYTADPSVTPSTPLRMDAMLRNIPATLEVRNSTYTYEDFMRVFTNGTDSGPVIITVRSHYAPQIWTRTYNQTETGTFGQFIPAIRIDAAAGAGSAFGEGKYYMAGLRHDSRFRTNLGFLNPNPTQTINATVKVYDDTQKQVGQFTLALPPYQLDQFPITAAKAVPDLSPERPFSLQIEVPAGQWLIGYASYIDNASGDPVYIQAIRESELNLIDYNNIVIPGVGHVGEWRSDVTIYNPDTQSVSVDLTYHDQTGSKIAEARSVLIRPREFLQYTDFLKQGILGNVADSLGILRVAVTGPFPPATYPLTFARTYNDKGTGLTFGQGIGGFAAARANVKPGKPALVAGIRSNTKYYTNVGLTNVSNVPVTATVKFLDPSSGAEQTLQTHTMAPNQSIVGRVLMPSQLETGSLKIEVTGGNLWAFASIVDVGTLDPEYVAATPLAQQ